LWACFIPLPRPGFALQGVSPLPSQLASRLVVPSCRWRVSPRNRLAYCCQLHSRRLQGFDPGSDPWRKADGLDLLNARFPPGLSTPAGFSPDALKTPSRPSAHDLLTPRTRCIRGTWPTAYQSATDLMIYLQTTFPFEISAFPSTVPKGAASS
jgi:hypothetical protein